jgi:uncharacterized protein (DUF2267 family)
VPFGRRLDLFAQGNVPLRGDAVSTPDAFSHALHTANIWLADVSKALGTDDRHHAQRVLRAWLHVLRDRLSVESAAKFAAQLPELLRGIYYSGWEPHRAPITYRTDQFTFRFAAEAGIPAAQVGATAAAVTAALGKHLSPGQLSEALAEFPADLRTILTDELPPVAHAAPADELDRRVHRLEDQLNGLTQAVRALAHGLDNAQLTGFDPTHSARAARLADEILLATTHLAA